jgi:autotransporter-associated beta strand protein
VRFDQTTTGSYSGELSGGGALVKAGSGAVTLEGANAYTGATTVEGGSLIAANNNSLSSSAVTMSDGSVLAEAGVELANNFTIGTAASFATNTVTGLIAGWDFSTNAGGTGNYGPQGMAPSSSAEGISIVGLTRGSGVGTTGTGAGNAWGGINFSNNSAASAITAEKFVFFSFVASNNVTLSITNFGDYNVRRSGTGPTTGLWQWSTNGSTFTDIGSDITWGGTTTAAGNAQSAISLNGIAGLQDVASGTTVTFRLANWGGTTGTWYLNDPTDTTGLDFTVNGSVTSVSGTAGTGTGTLGISEVGGSAIFSGGVTVNNTATFTAASGGQATFSGVVSGPGTAGITKTGAGTVTLSGSSANTFTGTTTVSAGTLELAKTADTTAIAGNLVVSSGATLLLSESNQVSSSGTTVSLSGGTITRASGVSEVFGNLNLSAASFLDFGSGGTGTLSFGTYTPSALTALNIVNFTQGNTLTFGSNLTSSIETSAFAFSGNGGLGSYSWDNDSSTFTITAIPEPSTYLAAAGLLSLMLWPSRKRLLKDAKKILGITPPMRDRLAARREQRSKVEA